MSNVSTKVTVSKALTPRTYLNAHRGALMSVE